MAGCGLLVVLIGVARGGVDPVLAGGAALIGLAAGVLSRDWYLTRQLQRREAAMLAEFPVVADLLALALVAGEAPPDALQRVCRLTHGELARDLEAALARARSGAPLTTALADLAERTTLEPFSRFVHGLVVAIERGTPLADVLRAQAVDVREAGKRALLEAGGRKEISMMLRILALSSLTERNVPRRMAWRSMMPNQTSTRLSHDPDVWVKCTCTRGFAASQRRTSTRLWAA
jgi:tight adherence protein C